jgi:hypothetical protein
MSHLFSREDCSELGAPAQAGRRYERRAERAIAAERSGAALTGVKGGPIRRSNFNKLSGWPYAVRAIGAEGLHVQTFGTAETTWQASAGSDCVT